MLDTSDLPKSWLDGLVAEVHELNCFASGRRESFRERPVIHQVVKRVVDMTTMRH